GEAAVERERRRRDDGQIGGPLGGTGGPGRERERRGAEGRVRGEVAEAGVGREGDVEAAGRLDARQLDERVGDGREGVREAAPGRAGWGVPAEEPAVATRARREQELEGRRQRRVGEDAVELVGGEAGDGLVKAV